jgi:hypothetical protein
MSNGERENDQPVAHGGGRTEPLLDHGAGHPTDETLSEESEPGQLEDTPRMSGEDQVAGQTEHPAPADDVGVPDESGN